MIYKNASICTFINHLGHDFSFMKDLDLKTATDNIFTLLHVSGVSDIEFSNLLGISIRWFRYIKSGKYYFKDSEIRSACSFFAQKYELIDDKNFEVKNNLRKSLISRHKNNIEYSKILNDTPTIAYAIEFKLLDHPNFQDQELEIKDINKIFRESGWRFKSTSLSNALKKMTEFIRFRPSPTKKGTHLYSKK